MIIFLSFYKSGRSLSTDRKFSSQMWGRTDEASPVPLEIAMLFKARRADLKRSACSVRTKVFKS